MRSSVALSGARRSVAPSALMSGIVWRPFQGSMFCRAFGAHVGDHLSPFQGLWPNAVCSSFVASFAKNVRHSIQIK